MIAFDGSEYLGLYCPQLSKDGNGAFSIGDGIAFWLSVVAWKFCEYGETMKTKLINHEQYCKKFVEKTEMDLQCDFLHQKEIEKCEKMVKACEESEVM